MAYRAPGAYARFVKSASAVANAGDTRVMAIVGTGAKYYEIYNESIKKSDSQSYDKLSKENVFEIMSVSSKAISLTGKNNPENVYYTEGTAFTLKDNKYIAWNTIADPEIVIKSSGTSASLKLKEQVTILPDSDNSYLAKDGEYLLEVMYIEDADSHSDIGHVPCGAYRIIDNETKEILCEYGVSQTPRYDAIPGFKLTVSDVFVAGEDGESVVNIGDYIIIKTTAGKTEIEANVAFDSSISNYSQELEEAFTVLDSTKLNRLMVVSDANVITDQWDLQVVDASTGEIQITKISTGEVIYGPKYVGYESEYLNIIPGVTFLLPSLPSTISSGATVRITTTERVAGAAVSEDDIYYVSYKYHKAESEYVPKVFNSYDDVVAEYGNYDVTASSVVLNSLSLGAEIAFSNGVTPIVCVQAKNDSDYEMEIAIDKLKTTPSAVANINSIIPLTQSQYVGAYLVNHVNLMSSEDEAHERMGYIGAYINQKLTKTATALDKTVGMVETAKGYDNERIVYVVPGNYSKDIKSISTGKVNERVLPGCYAAVAVAAIGLKNDPAEPLTNKTIAGLKEVITTYLDSEKKILSSNGCLVLEPKGNNIKIRHGVTTDPSEVNSTEITLIQIKDYVIQAVRKSCGELYIGRKNTSSVVADVQYTIKSILNQFISQTIIIGYDSLTVKKSTDDPREILVSFQIEAVYPLNYITISFGFSSNS